MSTREPGAALRAFLGGDPPPAFALVGDSAGLAELLAAEWTGKLKSEGQTVELTRMSALDMERESPTFAWRSPSFFVSHRLYLLPEFSSLKKGIRDEILGYLKEPEHRVVLFVPCGRKDPVLAIRSVKAVSLRFDQVEDALASYAIRSIADAGRSISRSAASFLARWVGPDFPRMKEEVGKLLASVGEGKPVGEEDIRSVCVAAGYEFDPFAFADALIARDREKVVGMFRRFAARAEREEYYKLLGAVSWKVRTSAGRLGPEWGSALVETLASIDRGIKGESELSPEQFVEISLLKLLG